MDIPSDVVDATAEGIIVLTQILQSLSLAEETGPEFTMRAQ